MRKEERIDMEKIVNAVIDNLLEEKEPEETKTPYLEKYETPAGLKIRNINETFVPVLLQGLGTVQILMRLSWMVIPFLEQTG